jgi:hypothetical protein
MEQSSCKVRRCAIYTRKSSAEGLEQDFNSLHAQRVCGELLILGKSVIRHTQAVAVARSGQASSPCQFHAVAPAQRTSRVGFDPSLLLFSMETALRCEPPRERCVNYAPRP